ncbi:10183_t:CDS:2 [Gigaspora margarita]|uniref:10183_t:CDS:1 n=1 Tax=Gigaspora margarita TaxID=4874 RepID=A0ABN7UGF2_GIGMA|nr:10183_t:CDS:2 [Gigaspora margarita]
MTLIITEPSTTADLLNLVKIKHIQNHFSKVQALQTVLTLQKNQIRCSSSDVHASKDKNGSKFGASSKSFEGDVHSQGFTAQAIAKDNHGNHFDASKSSSEKDGKIKASLSDAHASKDKNGSKFDANKKSFEADGYVQNSLSKVNAGDSHGNYFDASKSSNEKNAHGQSSSSGVSASKGKSGSKFDANNSSSEFGGFSQVSKVELAPKKRIKGKGGSKSNAVKNSYELVGHSQNTKSNVNAKDNHEIILIQVNAPMNKVYMVKALQAVQALIKVKNISALLKKVLGAKSFKLRSQ